MPFGHPVRHCFSIEFLAVGFGCLVLTSIGSSMVAGVVVGIYVPEKGRFPTLCTVIVAHAFFIVIGAGFLLSCFLLLVVVLMFVQSSMSSRISVSLGRSDL